MKPAHTIKIYESPLRLLVLIGVTIFLTHAASMVVFSVLPQFVMGIEAIVQSTLFLLLLFPVLYFFSFRPLILHITERDEAEKSMWESESKYRSLFEHLSDAAFLVALDTGRILDTNPQGERLLDRTRAEIMGMNQSQLYPPRREPQMCRHFAADTQDQRPQDRVTEISRRDGSLIPARVSCVPTTFRGRKLTILFVRELPRPGARQSAPAPNMLELP